MNKYKKRYKNQYSQSFMDFLFFLAVLPAAAAFLKTRNIILAGSLFAGCLVLIVLVIKGLKHRKNVELRNSGLHVVDTMRGEQFEEFLLQHFKRLGYSGYVTRGSQDFGADLVVTGNGVTMVIQAKRWKNKIGIDAVQQVAGAVKHYKADQGIVVTNNFFTQNAVELANSCNVLIWDRNKLISLLQNHSNRLESIEPVPPVEPAENQRVVCPQCGKELLPRKGKRGPFLGCSGYPGCRFTKSM